MAPHVAEGFSGHLKDLDGKPIIDIAFVKAMIDVDPYSRDALESGAIAEEGVCKGIRGRRTAKSIDIFSQFINTLASHGDKMVERGQSLLFFAGQFG